MDLDFFFPDRVQIQLSDGSQRDNIQAQFTKKGTILLPLDNLAIREGDLVRRKLPNGIIEEFEIDHVDYQLGHRGLPPITTLAVRKRVSKVQKQSVQNYNVSGVNPRTKDDDDRRFALLAIEEARKSVPEDERPHPKVGALIVKDGVVLSQAHRGEMPKSHAEYVALEDKLSDDLVAGATVYTTLEPCTTRKHPKIPCAQRLKDRKVGRVVIGMLDPNPDIRGRGDQLLSDAGIEVQLFPRDLRAQVEEMNRDFIRAQKMRQTATGSETVESDPKEFWEQRKKLPETELLRKIWSKPYWHVWIRPTEFKRARFQNVEQCRQFILSSEVRVQDWFAYPSFSPETLEICDEWISGEIEHSSRTLNRAERWSLFRNGQFIHNRTFDEIPQLGERVHVIEILDIATAGFEFAARMAERGVLAPSAAITFELHGIAGRSLTWPQDLFGDIDAVGRNCWCQDEIVIVERQITTDELRVRKRTLALDVALEIYARFGWTEAPEERIESQQNKRFGSG
jgi:pyrimidine deaminase RibD-like protein